MGVLGCAATYEIMLIEEIVNLDVVTGASDFGRPLGTLEFESVVWDRRQDDTSEATVVIPTNTECCTTILADAHVWHHGIAIYRDGELVWDGPIVLITASRTQVTIVARDVSALLSKRLLPRDLCFSNDATVCTAGSGGMVYGPQTPEFVAVTLIQEALSVDSHGVVLSADLGGATEYEGYYKRFGGPVFDLVQKLATDYINWTVIGRRIIITRGGAAGGGLFFGFARTALLTCEDFLNDTFSTTEDGLSTLTQDVQIADPIVIAGVEQSNIGIGQIFPVGTVADAYYGLLQAVQDGNENLNVGTTGGGGAPNSGGTALADAAVRIVSGSYPPPMVLDAAGLQLSPNAPVTIAELVPGTFVPILADCLCRPVQRELVLSAVVVTFDATGERVEPTFISAGSDNPGTFEVN